MIDFKYLFSYAQPLTPILSTVSLPGGIDFSTRSLYILSENFAFLFSNAAAIPS
jgi:hypothetical protein